MHEASLVAAMCAEIERLAAQEGAQSVTRILVRLGAFSGVEKEAFLLAFEAFQKGHPLFQEAQLELEWLPAQRVCFSCQETFTGEPPCPRCGSWQAIPLGGDELELAKVEFQL